MTGIHAHMIGFVAKDVYFGATNEQEYAAVTVAVDQGYGEKKYADFVTCWFRGPLLDRLKNAKVKKGSYLYVQGNLKPVAKLGESKEAKEKKAFLNLNLDVTVWDFAYSGSKEKEDKASTPKSPEEEADDLRKKLSQYDTQILAEEDDGLPF